MPWIPTKNPIICNAHFVDGKKSEDPKNDAYNVTMFPPEYKKCAVKRKHILNVKRTARLNAWKERIISK